MDKVFKKLKIPRSIKSDGDPFYSSLGSYQDKIEENKRRRQMQAGGKKVKTKKSPVKTKKSPVKSKK